MTTEEIINQVTAAKVGEEIQLGSDFPYDDIQLIKNITGSGFSWRMGFNQKLFKGNRMPTYPMVGRMVKSWKREASARNDLLSFLIKVNEDIDK